MIAAPSKWRPSLALITAGMIGLVLVAALASFAVVRFNIRQSAGIELTTALALALIAAAIVGGVFVRTIQRPVHELVERAQRIAGGDASAIAPLSHHGTRELASLSDNFMHMARSLSDHSVQVRTYARHVSHELKTPLAGIRGAAELMRDSQDMPQEQRQRFLQNIVLDVSRMTALLDRLGEQARAEAAASPESAPIGAALPSLASDFPSLRLEAAGDLDCLLAMSAENIAMVLQHLAANAAEHGATQLDITATADASACEISIGDNGAGIGAGNWERVFEPFFTTRRKQGGTGMGLAIVRTMLEAHRGTITLAPSDNGARFVLRVPIAARGLHAKP